MAAKGQKFSFGRLITNIVPNFAKDDANDVNLSPAQADSLLTYQLSLPSPRYLGEKAFFVADIVGHEAQSKTVYKTLIKHNLILPTPEAASSAGAASSGEPMTVNTAQVTKNFANQFATISVHVQRKLVGMLFFWEEECTRWKLLDAEEAEILKALETNQGNMDLACALEAVEMKKKTAAKSERRRHC